MLVKYFWFFLLPRIWQDHTSWLHYSHMVSSGQLVVSSGQWVLSINRLCKTLQSSFPFGLVTSSIHVGCSFGTWVPEELTIICRDFLLTCSGRVLWMRNKSSVYLSVIFSLLPQYSLAYSDWHKRQVIHFVIILHECPIYSSLFVIWISESNFLNFQEKLAGQSVH